ncbi:MAG TPA: ATP-dependent 6-phosphofructokinase, partial [Calditrichia bacterium]|nr:ATP-dependent 6-phosphofructokinase [Calditrichia bacterium]
MGKRRIGILTGGGDCPGLNAVIRGVTKSAILQEGMEVIGFHDGFEGLVEERFSTLRLEDVSGILTTGGTILGTSNSANPFKWPVGEGEKRQYIDKSDDCMRLYEDLGLEALFCVGGDGTLSIGGRLAEKGARLIGVPKTIDNDIMETDMTFGFDTARSAATDAIDRLHDTAQSHHRVMLVEVMGRNAGWLALESGISGGGDVILIPEIPYEIEEIVSVVRKRSRFGKRFSIVVVSEGVKAADGQQQYQNQAEDPLRMRLGGVAHHLAAQIEDRSRVDCRVTILGHLQRGGRRAHAHPGRHHAPRGHLPGLQRAALDQRGEQ